MNHLNLTRTVSTSLLLTLMALAAPNSASALPIDPGFDLFATPPGGAFVNIFGGPTIPLQGNPVGPGNADTIVRRLGGLGDGQTGQIQTEIVAMSLKSVEPISVIGSFFDVFVDLDLSQPSTGHYNVTTHDNTGGTFDSFFDVFTELTLVDVSNPTNVFHQPMQQTITTSPAPWSHTAPAGYPTIPNLPAGNFYLTGEGLHGDGLFTKRVPAVPEPSTLALAAFALLGLAGYSWRRQRRSSNL